MAYRIVIVDDEEDIREGLADLVDWPGLGYTVAARLEDGRDAISFIQSHPVDVILTDIKMTFVSGLELAQYVFDRQYGIKIVLISGYKEFAFAQQALQYQVSHYLLKPTRLDDIHRVFGEVKAALDKEQAEKERTLGLQSRHEEMLSQLRSQFFAELAAGTLTEREELTRRLQLVQLPVHPQTHPCCLYAIRLTSAEPRTAGDAAERNAARLLHFIQQSWRQEQDCIQHIPLCAEADLIRMAAVDLRVDLYPAEGPAQSSDASYLTEKIPRHFDLLKGKIHAVLGIEARLIDMRPYAHLLDLTLASRAGAAAGIHPVLSPDRDEESDQFDPLVIQQAKTYIQDNYNQNLSLEDVAEHVYLSPVYFSRLFKKQTGRNFTEYVTEIRMRRAMDYLRQPQYKVYEIGALVGYRSTKYFFKLFKQYAGCTPTEYRNTLHPERERR